MTATQNVLLWLRLPVVVILCINSPTLAAPPVPEPFTEHCIVGEKSLYPPPKSTAVPWYTVDLDKDPEDRWTEIAGIYKQEINDLLDVIKDITFAFFEGKFVQWVDKHMGNWDDKLMSPFREEMKGISKVTGIPLGEIVLYNIFFELDNECTAILAQTRSGELYHARNMDFGLFTGWNTTTHSWLIPQNIRKLLIQVNFTRGGKHVFHGDVFPGYVGQFSSMKTNKFTLTLNSRHNFLHGAGWYQLIRWLLFGKTDFWFTTQLARATMEKAESYTEAKTMLMSHNTSTPMYMLLGGTKPNEGCLIVKDIEDVANITELAKSPTGFYILQTNYDPWKEPLYFDDRRDPGNRCMQKLSQDGVGFEGIFNVLSSPTNLNLLTMFTQLMKVDSHMETYTQNCPHPCWPW